MFRLLPICTALLHTLAGLVLANTAVFQGTVSQFSSYTELDLDGDIIYAVNFSQNDPIRSVNGVTFTPDTQAIPGASFIGPNNVTPWGTKPQLGTGENNALEEIMQDIRWATAGAGQRLEAHLAVTQGTEYKLQILISANRVENRIWDISVDGQNVVDELSSLGFQPGASYANNRCTVYTYQFIAPDNTVDVLMGNLFGANAGGDRNPIWQALTLEKVTIPLTPESLSLSADTFFAGQAAHIGRLETVDFKPGATHIYGFQPGAGDADNAKFTLTGDQLFAGPHDFSQDAPGTTYSVRIRTSDLAQQRRFIEEVFVLTLLSPQPPTAITFSTTSINRAAAVGSLVGIPGTIDPDPDDRHTYTLVPGAGDDDNALFALGSTLRFAGPMPTNAVQLTVRIRSTDLAGLFIESPIVLDVLEPSVRISEFMASNAGTYADEDGAFSDWIEIQNELGQIVDLDGWYLTDDPDDLTRWRLPSILVDPHEFHVVFASGKDRTDPEAHTNFKLGSGGEYLALVKPDGVTIADQYAAVPAFPDISYGDDTTGAQRGYQQSPSPGLPNGPVFTEALSEVGFSHARGYYTNSFNLVLTGSIPGGTIRYSTDGSDPSGATGIDYTGPVPITPETTGTRRGTRRIRAVALHPDAAFNPIGTHTYLFVNGLTGPGTDGIVGQSVLQTVITGHPVYGPLIESSLLSLPVISVVKPGNITATEAETSIEFFTPDGSESGFQINCGIKIVGGASVGSPKNNWRLFFRGDYGTSRLSYPLFNAHPYGKGTDSFDVLQLHSGSHDSFYWLARPGNPNVANRHGDAQYVRNRWINDMQLLMGHEEAVHGRPVMMYYNGTFHGLYYIHERPTQHFHASYMGGQAEDYHYTNSARTGSDHGGGDSWSTTWNEVKATATNWEQAKALIDLENLADYMLLNFYAGNSWDWTNTHNWMAGGPQDPGRGGWKFHCWDSDIILQDVNNNNLGRGVPNGLFDSLMNQQPDFQVLFRDRVYHYLFHGGLLSPGEPTPYYDYRMNEIFDAIVVETARWQPADPVNPPWGRDGEWQTEWNYMRDVFFEQRPAILLAQLRGKGWYPVDAPEFNQRGGVVTNGFAVTLSAPLGSIHYTTDGSDPRLEGGATRSSAQLYTGPIIISGDLVIRARALNGTQWSPINSATFVLDGRVPAGPDNLLITEVHYNPQGFDDYEFIEFKNLLPFSTIDLSGVTLSNTVSFTFPPFTGIPPGGHLVVAENDVKFEERYMTPGSPWHYQPIILAGQWSGALGNGGARITVLDSNRNVIVEVDYSDSGDWPARADGNGSSAELVNPVAVPGTPAERAAYFANGSHWRPSSEFHGSPGRDGSGAGPVILHEVLTHSGLGDDWIELHNPGTEAVDVGNWFLSDSLGDPFKYQFAPTNLIPGGGYLVVPESAFNTVGGEGVHTPFALSRSGEEVVLCEVAGTGPGTNLARIVDRFDFGPAEFNVPFGLYEKSDGDIDYPAMRSASPGQPNDLPRVGPLVITEIIYDPGTGGVEYIEIDNLGAANLALFDPAHPTNTWRLTGAVTFDFPTNVTFDACSKIIVCATNPAAFTALLGPVNAQVFGPWSGALDNAGDTLRLRKPGPPDLTGVPYILVEEVDYLPEAPWPVATNGMALTRITDAAYANDPINWIVNLPGPGEGQGNLPPLLTIDTNLHAVVDSALDLNLSALDPDAPWQTLSFTLESPLPTGATFDPTNRLFRWTPPSGSAGLSTQLLFRVSDGAACQALSHSLPVQFTVHGIEAPVALADAQATPTEQVIRWSAIPGQVYEIEVTDDLKNGTWELLATVIADALEESFTDINNQFPGVRYYRVRWMRE